METFVLAQNALFYWLVGVSCQASVLVALVLGTQRPFEKQLSPGWSHALWLLVLLRFAGPSPPKSGFSILNLSLGSLGATHPSLAHARQPGRNDRPGSSVLPTISVPIEGLNTLGTEPLQRALAPKESPLSRQPSGAISK